MLMQLFYQQDIYFVDVKVRSFIVSEKFYFSNYSDTTHGRMVLRIKFLFVLQQ